MRFIFARIAVVIVLLLAVALAQSDADVMKELCEEWAHPNPKFPWPNDCDGFMCLADSSTWNGVNCDQDRITVMSVGSFILFLYFSF